MKPTIGIIGGSGLYSMPGFEAHEERAIDTPWGHDTVTVLALPEEAEMLTLAQELGTLTLLLRNPDDLDSQEKRSVVDQKVLFTGDRASELQQKRYRTIQIIRGNRSDAVSPREP